MWKFEAEQKKYRIGNVEVGGVPGERPTVLVGSIFHHKHRVVRDEQKGEFDRKTAEALINLQHEFSDKTGNPCMLDVVGSTPEALEKFIDFAAEVSDGPLLLDGVSESVRLPVLDHVKAAGLSERIVYNTVSPRASEGELEKIKEAGIKSAVLLICPKAGFGSKERVATAKELLKTVKKAGVEKPLIDTCILDVPTLGFACRTITQLKNELGAVMGGGAHNAVDTWRGLRSKMGLPAVKPAEASANILIAAAGADFILYGPLENAEYVFPTVAMVDAAFAQLRMEEGVRISREHPKYRIA
jgi:tetrahydromethanopterin S-methyltransferase subunit H